MAERRMFAKTIIDSDAFLDMPLSSQALYFHLSMRADDEGFINNPKKIQRMIGASDDDLKVLIAKSFIIPFESGIVVIKHWKIHNYIRGDRVHETKYLEEKALLNVKKNGSYTISADICLPDDRQMSVKSQADGIPRLGKVSIDKDSIDKNNIYCRNFEETYSEYPRKGDKKRAYACYKARLKEGYSEEELLQATKNYAEQCRKEKREQRYIKLASTFFGVNTPFVDYLNGDSKDGSTNNSSEILTDEYIDRFADLV